MTTQGQFALLVFGRTTDPANIPVSSGPFAQAEQQVLLWGYPDILWGAGVIIAAVDDLVYFIQNHWHRR